jgi:lysozyme
MVLEEGFPPVPQAQGLGQVTKARNLAAALTVGASVLVSVALKEDYRGEAYPDPATRGAPWTIGFGETAGVRQGDRTTPTRALVQLEKSLGRHAAGVVGCIHVPLSQGEFDASVSLAYNIGVGAYCRSSVAARFNAGDYAGGCLAILAFNKARVNGKLQVMRGLAIRRYEEYNTCIGG